MFSQISQLDFNSAPTLGVIICCIISFLWLFIVINSMVVLNRRSHNILEKGAVSTIIMVSSILLLLVGIGVGSGIALIFLGV